MLRYLEEVYENSIYFQRSKSVDSSKLQKIVTVRSTRNCLLCDTAIHKRETSLFIKEICRGVGWIHGWICIDCCNEWLEKTRQVQHVERCGEEYEDNAC